ncbi:MAG: pantetheine-phosphate adenylyltransferase [Fimbriimonadales bacterium]|nr:pantetheine-phosphate adenylyltransferase [Fimbriimonadales bacterium]
MPTAIYAGSFDPPTLGHQELIRRASSLFSMVIVAVGINSDKSNLFALEERMQMLREISSELRNVEVTQFDGLLVDFARLRGATILIRGLRVVSDFEHEFQMSLTNRTLAPEIETAFLMATAEHMFVSSSIVKEVARLGGDVSKLVPPAVADRLKAKFKHG